MGSFEKGLVLFRKGKFREAADVLENASRDEPANVKIWNALGVALSKAGDNTRALIAADMAVRLEPENPVCVKNRNKILEKSQNTFEIDESTYIKADKPVKQVILKKPVPAHISSDDFIQVEEEEEFIIEGDLQCTEEGASIPPEIKTEESLPSSGHFNFDNIGDFNQDEQDSAFPEEKLQETRISPEQISEMKREDEQSKSGHTTFTGTEPELSPGYDKKPDISIETPLHDDEFQQIFDGPESCPPFRIPPNPFRPPSPPDVIAPKKKVRTTGIPGWIIALSAILILLLIGIVLWNAGLFQDNTDYSTTQLVVTQVPDYAPVPTTDISGMVPMAITPVPSVSAPVTLEKTSEPASEIAYDDADFYTVTSTMMSQIMNELASVESTLNNRDYSQASGSIENVLDLVYNYTITCSTYSLSKNATETSGAVSDITDSVESAMDYAKKAIEASELGEKEVEKAHLMLALQNIKKVTEEMKTFQVMYTNNS